MNKIKISDEAYAELIGFLDNNDIKNCNVRISILGGRCSGPVFQITASEPQADDVIEKVKDTNFVIGRALIDECAGFTILSSEENHGKKISIQPFNPAKKDCKSCGRGCP